MNDELPPFCERVAAGAKLLDENEGGWAKRINMTVLDMGEADFCVLGQLYGNYWDAVAEKERVTLDGKVEPTSTAYELGFQSHTDLGYRQLQRCWKDEIRARRKAGKSA